MSRVKEAQKRWDWINGWLAAALHACIRGTKLSVSPSLTITEVLKEYSRKVRGGLQGGRSVLSTVVEDWESDYVFQLEQELWGADWQHYINFFPGKNQASVHLQTFHFVLCFYVVERCLKLLVNQTERYKISRGRLRQWIFGKDKGLMSVQWPKGMRALGLPFCLAATTRNVEVPDVARARWQMLGQESLEGDILRFYRATTGKAHYVEIVEAALRNAHEDHLTKSFRKRKGEKLPDATRAYWYDVLWHYSEAIRYRPLLPSQHGMAHPYYWNRTVRWFTSVVITGLLLMAQSMGASVARVWDARTQDGLWHALGGNGRFGDGGITISCPRQEGGDGWT
ncbi:hypothetical protein G4L39_06480 [Limisphaera ngatamarikiensis]|uniref:Uncharacterized protein n=1 Tax=Limisphaera ngatamarikiensis TaxID=1324935 RepID=A0A6M1RW91_9BACT|nr:hypothetical protein [Limisphaera ngatamarikiensis]NGO39042.1 hypothetical protein [Limisphaera ngatamarikiensis]